MQLLQHEQIQHRVERLAIQILENNYEAERFQLIGINMNGMAMAKRIQAALTELTNKPLALYQVEVNLNGAPNVHLHKVQEELSDEVVIVIDDVANTGRTLFYAMEPFMEIQPKKIEVAVLIDRKHKLFPVRPDYVGLSLATTFQEHIEVCFSETTDEAFLK